MKIGNSSRRGTIEHGQNVRLTLGQAAFTEIIKIKTDPVRRAMNWMNKM